MRKAPPDYWKYLSSEKKSQGITEPIFHKIIEANHKITFSETDENSKNDKPVENKPINIFSKSTEEIEKFLLYYFQKHNIKSIKLESENLIIENNGGSTVTNLQTLLTTSPELQGIDRYLQNKSGKTVSRHELEVGNNSDNTSTPPNNKIALWVGCGISGIVVIVVIIKLLLKKKSKLKKQDIRVIHKGLLRDIKLYFLK